MIKKLFLFIFLSLLLLLFHQPHVVSATLVIPTTHIYQNNQTETTIKTQTNTTYSDYVINDFTSAITINQDTSLSVVETIVVNFYIPKHGIYRNIPYLYANGNRRINSNLKVNSVLLDSRPANFVVNNYNQSKQIKIGDANTTITGQHKYRIAYQVNNVLQRYADHDELYWNVTGHEWDTVINETRVTIDSPFAGVTKTDCFSGKFGTTEKYCQAADDYHPLDFITTRPLKPGDDFTIVVGLDKNNQLGFPGPTQMLLQKSLLLIALITLIFPSLFALFSWYKKGRDQRYLSDNIYVTQAGQPIRNVGLFERKYLPLAYQPIKGLSPAQAGTIIDEKVDIQDVVAEIIELARLGFLNIEKKTEKKFFGTKTEYVFTKKQKLPDRLQDHQSYLLEKLFDTSNQVQLSELKDTFYRYLNVFKVKLYDNMKEAGYFDGNPQKVKGIWFLKFFLVGVSCLFITMLISGSTGNFLPLVFLPAALPLNLVLTILTALKMPRRTALGYSYYRQLEGLRFFIDKGKWREEIAEKNLFLEEILPLAICLGVVTKLANDMKDLALPPPDYLTGFTTTSFARDFSNFSTTTANTLVSSPHSSGSSSWSGGSGFSGGGHSGGGFGGGGGGSW